MGTLAVFIRADLDFGETGLGAVVSLYYLTSAVASVPGGRIAERLGGRRAMALAAAITLPAVAGIAALASSWTILALLLVLAGIGNGFAFPASNLALTRGFPVRRLGIAFAVKQSAGPYAVLIAGLSVPTMGLTIGWRWAFVLVAIATLPIIAGGKMEMVRAGGRTGSLRSEQRRPLRILAGAAMLVVMATSSLGAFFVESAVAGGVGAGVAGTLLAVGSVAGVLTRLVWGWLADNHPTGHFVLLPLLLGLGAGGFLFLAAVESGPPLVGATIIVFITAWSWPGVLTFAVVQRNSDAPAAATGIIGAGQYGGGIIGPFGFGLVVDTWSYASAWRASALVVALSAALMALGGRSLQRSQAGAHQR